MEEINQQPEIDPRTEALEEVAFTAWQFAASFQRLPFRDDINPVRPPEADDWIHAVELVEEYTFTPEDIEQKAKDFFQETLRVLYPDEEVEFFQKIHRAAIRRSRLNKARFAIKGAVERRIFRNLE